MANVSIMGDILTVEMQGLDKFWSLRSRLELPLANVRGATADPGIARGHHGLRGGGTHVPGLLTAGTFHQDGDRVFWGVHNAANVVVIELEHERYNRLVIEVDDPRAVVAAIEQAIATRR